VPEVIASAVTPVSPGSGSAEFDAFLSYTHRDRLVANGIERGLHQVGRRLGQLRALRVFRDDTNLEVSPDLWGKITDAMDRCCSECRGQRVRHADGSMPSRCCSGSLGAECTLPCLSLVGRYS
jgi:hypothetical protein